MPRIITSSTLAKNPDGYCGLGGTGISCPVGIARSEQSQVPHAHLE